jgi:hypothetical protein
MYRLLLVSILGLTSCAAPENTDGVFTQYMQSFNAAASSVNSKAYAYVPITFGDTTVAGSDVVGLCYLSGSPRVLIDEDAWNTSSSPKREVVVFHELGHCVLGRQHRTDLSPDGSRPMSIMFPYVLDADTYMQHRQEYIKELFSSP